MAKYTTEVRSICEELSGFGSGGYQDVKEIITAAIPKIFDFDFPVFDENYRRPLCFLILRHFYTREIGFETYGLWKLKLETALCEFMPYANKFYKAELITFNPMHNVDVTTTNKLTRKTTQDDNTETTASSSLENNRVTTNSGSDYDLYSATPQGGLQGVDSERYLTDARKYVNGKVVNDDDTETTSANSTTEFGSNVDTTEDYMNTIVGKNSGESFSEMLLKFRETFMNVDMLVLEHLEPLFMGVW